MRDLCCGWYGQCDKTGRCTRGVLGVKRRARPRSSGRGRMETVGWEAGVTPFAVLPTCLLRTNARSSAIHAAAPASLNLAVAQQQHPQGDEAAANGAVRVRARDALVSRLAAESDEPSRALEADGLVRSLPVLNINCPACIRTLEHPGLCPHHIPRNMEPSQTTAKPTGIPRPGGIPRLSKLPVVNKKPTQLPAPKTVAPREIPAPTPTRPTTARASSQQRSSIVPPSRSTSSTRAPAIPTPRKAIPNPTKPTATSSIPPRPRAAPPRPASRLRRPPQTAVPRRQPTEDEETIDQLGSLDGFRTASRQGFHDDASPEEQPEPVLEPEIETPKPRKSRPSLSDRTIESLQTVPSTPKDRRRSSFYSSESPMGPPPRPSSSMSRTSSVSSRPGQRDRRPV